jgi:transposase
MDRGMVSEDNLELMRKKKMKYLVGTPKSMLKKFERELLESNWEEVESGVEVKLCATSEGSEETFILCRSQGRIEKEIGILNRFVTRLETALNKLVQRVDGGKIRDRQKLERRIGRLLERYSRVARIFDISVKECQDDNDRGLKITVRRDDEKYRWVVNTCGNYLLRTNWNEKDPQKLWKTYIQLTQVEDAFRITKSDLGIRPIYHHRSDRTQAHILVCFLALAMWRTLEQWMSGCGLGTAPRKLLEELREVRSMDVLLPTRDKTIKLRVVSTAPRRLKVLLYRLGLLLPNRPKIVENVVKTFVTS